MTHQDDPRRYTPSYERNHEPIARVLAQIAIPGEKILEVGSGSGQHICHLASTLKRDSGEPFIWQPTEQAEHVDSVEAWRQALGLSAWVEAPEAIDLLDARWDTSFCAQRYGMVMSVNVAHIVAWQGVEHLIRGAARLLIEGGVLYFYGPFRYQDRALEPSNEEFEAWLKERDEASGIRIFEEVVRVARECGLSVEGDVAMPAHNRSIWFRK